VQRRDYQLGFAKEGYFQKSYSDFVFMEVIENGN